MHVVSRLKHEIQLKAAAYDKQAELPAIATLLPFSLATQQVLFSLEGK